MVGLCPRFGPREEERQLRRRRGAQRGAVAVAVDGAMHGDGAVDGDGAAADAGGHNLLWFGGVWDLSLRAF